MKRPRGGRGVGVCLALTLLLSTAAVRAQSAAPVAALDAAQFTSPWFELARSANKREKRCLSDNVVLYALNDKKNSFQVVTSCEEKQGNWQSWNDKGKLDPTGGGRLRLSRWVFLHSDYWVLAAAPDYGWMLVGSPNHKSFWMLSKTPTVAPEVMSAMEARAAAAGFATAKLVRVEQHQASVDSMQIASGGH